MDAVTYPEQSVIEFITSNVIPLRIPSGDPLADQFNVQWTPTLVLLDAEGKEHSRTVGYLGPTEIIPVELLGIARLLFNQEKTQEMLAVLDKIITQYTGSDQTPEVIFFYGVAMYKHTHDPKHLRTAYDRLTREYPGHEWTKRAYPYRLIGE